MLKEGDKVIVKDNSYSLKITENGLKKGLPARAKGQVSPVYTIKKFKEKLPAYRRLVQKDKDNYNNTIIENELGEVYFIKRRQLVKAGTKEYKRVIERQSEPFESTLPDPDIMPYEE